MTIKNKISLYAVLLRHYRCWKVLNFPSIFSPYICYNVSFFNDCISSSANYILTPGWQSLATTVTDLVNQFLQAQKQYALESWSTFTGKRRQAAIPIHRRMDRNWIFFFFYFKLRFMMVERHSEYHPKHFCTSLHYQLYVYHSK